MSRKLYPGIMAAVLAADCAGKKAARHYVKKFGDQGERPVKIQLLENKGMAGGMLEGEDALINSMSSAVILAVLWNLLRDSRKRPWSMKGIGLALAAGGGRSNLGDRLMTGSVTDYIRFPKLPGQLPGRLVFNLSDFAIAAGAILADLSD